MKKIFFRVFCLYTCLEIFLTAVNCRKFYYSSFSVVLISARAKTPRQKTSAAPAAPPPRRFFCAAHAIISLKHQKTSSRNSFQIHIFHVKKVRACFCRLQALSKKLQKFPQKNQKSVCLITEKNKN